MKTKLQQHIESTPITDPTPTVAMPKQPPPKPTLWTWLRALLPLFALVAVASADTIFTDIYGNVIGHVPWPVDHDIYVPVPTIGGPAPWLRPPPPTPTPKPATPVPAYHPWKPL